MNPAVGSRRVAQIVRGQAHGPVTRLMSPGDLGQTLKPFVFLDIFAIPDLDHVGMGMHPHSGIATVTVFTRGDAGFDDGEGNTGHLAYGGAEWLRAGRGVWHGKELGAGRSAGVAGFQLWLALPAELELSTPDSQYLEAECSPRVGPAHLILGRYGGAASLIRAPAGVNYLMVSLKPGETWQYETPEGHTIGWFAVAEGEVTLDTKVAAGELAVLDRSDGVIELRSTGDSEAKLVIGTAAPHPHDLHLGNHSVHTSAVALKDGERHIADLREKLVEREKHGTRPTNSPVPVLR